MGVFDDDEIRCSPADCLLLPRTHLLEVAQMHTLVCSCTHTVAPFFIVGELFALQGLKLQEQLILLTPCKPLRLCWESDPPCIHRGDSSSLRATRPSTSTTHIHSHLQLICCESGGASAGSLSPPGGRRHAAPCALPCTLRQFPQNINKMGEAKCKLQAENIVYWEG